MLPPSIRKREHFLFPFAKEGRARIALTTLILFPFCFEAGGMDGVDDGCVVYAAVYCGESGM